MAGASNRHSSDELWIVLIGAILASLWAGRLELALIGIPLVGGGCSPTESRLSALLCLRPG